MLETVVRGMILAPESDIIHKAHEDTEGNMKSRSGNDLCTAVKHFFLSRGTASPRQAEAKLSSDHGSSGRCAALS